jgi:hypothetical protein
VRRRTEHGAAAVEFALVLLPLMLIVLGVLQYGLYFNDYLQARQAVRQGARTAVVQTEMPCGPSTDYGAQIKCYTEDVTAPVSGPVAVRVLLPGATASSDGWVVGEPLLVCEAVRTADVAGMIPLPNDGYVLATTQMAIEVDTEKPVGLPLSGGVLATETDPTGADWSWCS